MGLLYMILQTICRIELKFAKYLKDELRSRLVENKPFCFFFYGKEAIKYELWETLEVK